MDLTVVISVPANIDVSVQSVVTSPTVLNDPVSRSVSDNEDSVVVVDV